MESLRKSASGTTPSVSADITDIVTDTLYRPTVRQRTAKAVFWAAASDNPVFNSEEMTAAEAGIVAKDGNVEAWWKQPGFRDWFFNSNEHSSRLEVLFSMAMDAAEDILLSTDPKTASARVTLIKTLAELTNRVPKQGGGIFLDGNIAKMDKAQLEAFLENKGVSVRTRKSPEALEAEVVADGSQK